MNNIKYISGDILSANTSDKGVVVCHQVNCRGVMGAGLAKQVRQMHPDIYAAYKGKCNQIKAGHGGLGDVQFYVCPSEFGYILANIFGQDDYGRGRDRYGNRTQYTDYNALHKAFTTIAQSFPTHTIRIPYYMGCGLGGGKWFIVEKMIKEVLGESGCTVEIWKYPVQTTASGVDTTK